MNILSFFCMTNVFTNVFTNVLYDSLSNKSIR